MSRRRSLLRTVGAVVLAVLLLVPTLVRGHAHPHGDFQPGCAACIVAGHVPLVAPAAPAAPAPTFAALPCVPAVAAAPDPVRVRAVVARGPPRRRPAVA